MKKTMAFFVQNKLRKPDEINGIFICEKRIEKTF